MKKKYTTPYLIVEEFQVDTAIASCSGDGGTAINKYESTCMGDDFYFASYCGTQEGGVDVTDPTGYAYDLICYQGPSGTALYFAS